MNKELTIVGIGGSTADSCSSSWALHHALESVKAEGIRTEQFLIKEMDLPMFKHEPGVPPPAAAQALADAIRRADGLIWSTPLYHGTVSGAFKNAIDWLQLTASHEPPYLSGKVVGLICAAGGTHGLQAINTMEFMVRALRGWTVPLVAPISRASGAFDSEGNFKDPAVERLLLQLGKEVVKGAKAMQAG